MNGLNSKALIALIKIMIPNRMVNIIEEAQGLVVIRNIINCHFKFIHLRTLIDNLLFMSIGNQIF